MLYEVITQVSRPVRCAAPTRLAAGPEKIDSQRVTPFLSFLISGYKIQNEYILEGTYFGDYIHSYENKNLENIVNELKIGDFVAFSYFPVDSLNDIRNNFV